MTTHKQDMSKLSINQLSQITGKAYNTVKRLLAGLDPAGKDGRTLYYLTADALARIYGAKGECEKERLDRVRADKVTFDLSVSRGEYLLLDDVEALLIEGAATFAGQKRSMGSRLAGKLASMTNPKAILKLLNAENDRILESVADKFSALSQRADG